MGQAISYALKQWDALTRFVSDARLPLDNNRSESALRKAAAPRSFCRRHLGSCPGPLPMAPLGGPAGARPVPRTPPRGAGC
ncbi:transposase, partial [Corallococcus sp. AB011P]|uniref:IS66 family transposase n=1 Tax=Corallococcus sp. AB011P TaxID=2316735 RepID=UPI0035134E17